MLRPDDAPRFDADDFTQDPPYPNGCDAMQLRDFVQEAINERLVLPLSVDPEGVLILLPDPWSTPGILPSGGID